MRIYISSLACANVIVIGIRLFNNDTDFIGMFACELLGSAIALTLVIVIETYCMWRCK